MADAVIDIDPMKLNIAQQSALLFLNQMGSAGVPEDVQLMALELASTAALIRGVKESKRLQFTDMWLKSIRKKIVAGLKNKKAKTNGK